MTSEGSCDTFSFALIQEVTFFISSSFSADEYNKEVVIDWNSNSVWSRGHLTPHFYSSPFNLSINGTFAQQNMTNVTINIRHNRSTAKHLQQDMYSERSFATHVSTCFFLPRWHNFKKLCRKIGRL